MRRVGTASLTLLVCALGGCTSGTGSNAPLGKTPSCSPTSTPASADNSPAAASTVAGIPVPVSSLASPSGPSVGETRYVWDMTSCGHTLRLVMITLSVTPSPDATTSPDGTIRKIAHVRIQDSGQPFRYAVSDFRFVAANGVVYEPVQDDAATSEPLPTSGSLTDGETVNGELMFDVPRGGGKVELFDQSNSKRAVWLIASP